MKEQNASEKKKARWSGEKKFYVFTAIGCAAVMLAIIIIAVAVSGKDKVNNQVDNGNNNVEISTPDENVGGEDSGNEETVGGLPEGMILPLSAVTVLNDYGFYYNQTLNSYYEHMGMDFTAAAGTEVYVVEDGVVESIYKDDLLSGTEIVVKHGNGLRSLYRFVTETADLKVGMEITGTVRNVVDFGAFIDIGVHQDGLVHISEITDRYIKHPSEVLKVGQVVQVRIKEVDLKKNRIGLTMKKKNG